jgi:hypothetical protein
MPPVDTHILLVALLPEARARLLPLCTLPELRADHVTLAHGVAIADLDPSWVPGHARVGERVVLQARALFRSPRVEALAVELAGLRIRPHDGQWLHLTLCRSPDARSHEANALVAAGGGTPCELQLAGVVGWRPVQRAP